MSKPEHVWTVDEVAHELDMVVFRLEQPPRPDSEAGLRMDRAELRRHLERLRDRLRDLRDAMK